jgi:hypothetical protein
MSQRCSLAQDRTQLRGVRAQEQHPITTCITALSHSMTVAFNPITWMSSKSNAAFDADDEIQIPRKPTNVQTLRIQWTMKCSARRKGMMNPLNQCSLSTSFYISFLFFIPLIMKPSQYLDLAISSLCPPLRGNIRVQLQCLLRLNPLLHCDDRIKSWFDTRLL